MHTKIRQISNIPKQSDGNSANQRIILGVMTKIRTHEARCLRFRLVLNIVLAITALIVLIPTVSYFAYLFGQSEAITYLSLIWSDSATILSNFGGWTISTINAWPINETIVLLAILLVLANSIRHIFKYWEKSATDSHGYLPYQIIK